MYKLEAHSTAGYAWDLPAAIDKRVKISIGGRTREVDIMEMGNLLPFKFSVSLLEMCVTRLVMCCRMLHQHTFYLLISEWKIKARFSLFLIMKRTKACIDCASEELLAGHGKIR